MSIGYFKIIKVKRVLPTNPKLITESITYIIAVSFPNLFNIILSVIYAIIYVLIREYVNTIITDIILFPLYFYRQLI